MRMSEVSMFRNARFWVTLFTFSAAVNGLSAQEFRGTITGVVTDQQGAVVANAAVAVTSLETGRITAGVTSDRGLYAVPELNPGRYSVRVTVPGFKLAIRNNVELRTGDRLALDVQLEVGSNNESVTVSAEAPLLETATASGGTVISHDIVASLPLLGSNPYSLLALTNGSSHISAFPDQLSERPFDNGGMDGYSVNGGPAGGNSNSYLIDGAPNNNNEGMGFVPNQAAVGEIRVMTNQYDAEYGRSGGAITSVSLKSGTNSLHGIGSVNLRNNHLNANLTQVNAQGKPVAAYHWVEPTFEIDGPVFLPKIYNGRNKTFFAFSYNYLFDSFPNPLSRIYPTALERQGDFAKTIGANGQPITIYDPTTTTASGSRTPFAGGVLPASRIDPVMLKLISLYPQPNVSCVPRGCSNFAVSPNTRGDHYHAYTAKVDNAITPKHKFFGVFELGSRDEFISNQGAVTPEQTGVFPATSTWRRNYGATLNFTSILSPTLISTAKVNWLRHNGLGTGADPGADPMTLGFSPVLNALFGANNFMGTSFTGSSVNYTGFTQAGRNATTFNTNWTASETLAKIQGQHSLKAGGVVIQTLQNNIARSLIPTLAFSDVFTRSNYNSADANSGDAIAAALLGYPASVTYTNPFQAAYATRYYALFVQDDWRISKNLTINLGLRWDAQTPATERYNRAVIGFDPSGTSTIGSTQVHGGLLYATSDHRSPYGSTLTNWQPRAGVAYTISRKLVFRGGWGRSYVQGYNFPPSTGYTATTSAVTSPDGTNRTPTLVPTASNPLAGLSAQGFAKLFPTGLVAPTGNSLGLLTAAGSTVSFIDPNYRQAYVDMFNAGLQYELPFRMVIQAEYNGSRSHHLAVNGNTGKPIDVLSRDQYLSLGASQNNSIANPFAGSLPGTTLNSSNWTLGQSLLPYPQFTGVNKIQVPIGNLWYDSLQIKLDKRLTSGLTYFANYTWSKNIGATDYMNANYDCETCLRRALVSTDQPHLLNMGLVYRVPAIRSSKVLNAAVGGWTVSGSAQFQSGNLIAAPTASGTNVFVQSTGLDPMKPTPYWSGSTWQRYFNTCTITIATGARSNCLGADEPAAWYIQPAFGLNGISPRFSALRLARPPIANLAISKNFSIVERVRMEIRADAFNLTNTPWFGFGDYSAGITTNASTSAFGQIASYPVLNQGNNARIIAVSGRISF